MDFGIINNEYRPPRKLDSEYFLTNDTNLLISEVEYRYRFESDKLLKNRICSDIIRV